jgi:hypothetical protein
MPQQTIYSFQIGTNKGYGSINRTYGYVNSQDVGLGPAYFWNNYFSSFINNQPQPSPFQSYIYFKYHD